MVKTPRTRHSKSQRAPVTIELGADEVKRVDEAETQAGTSEAAEASGQLESIEVPAQPDAELQKVEGEAHAEAAEAQAEITAEQPSSAEPASPSESASRSDYSFGRTEAGQAEPQPARARPTPARGGVSSVAAGIVGALIALGGLYGLQAAGVIGVPGSSPAPSLEPVESQIAALRSELKNLRNAPAGDPGLAAGLDQLKSEVSALQSAIQSSGGAGIAALDERIKKIESASGVPQAVNDQFSALQSKVAEAADSVGKSDARIATLEQSVSALTGKVEQQASQPKVALAIAAAALKSAVDRGGPFAAEAETFAAIAPEAPELAALRKYAEQGVATEADLVAAFPQAADSMMAAATPENPNAGILQRLLDSAQSVVKVRPVGSVTGDDPAARVARMEVALKAGDLEKAMAEYDGLPDNVKQAGAPLADRIKARIEVTKLVDQLVAGAMKSA